MRIDSVCCRLEGSQIRLLMNYLRIDNSMRMSNFRAIPHLCQLTVDTSLYATSNVLASVLYSVATHGPTRSTGSRSGNAIPNSHDRRSGDASGRQPGRE